MTNDEKLQKAKEFLGEKYLLHPSRRVQRLHSSGQDKKPQHRPEPGTSTVPV
jgi:hypothetical protein